MHNAHAEHGESTKPQQQQQSNHSSWTWHFPLVCLRVFDYYVHSIFIAIATGINDKNCATHYVLFVCICVCVCVCVYLPAIVRLQMKQRVWKNDKIIIQL